MNRSLALLTALTALTTFACDDGDSDSTFSSGIETTKTVSSLSDAEGQQYCDAMERSFSSLVSKRKACEIASAFFTEDQQSCNVFADQCVQAPPEPDTQPEGEAPPEDACLLAQADKREGCEETIETLDGCIEAVRGVTRNALARISCADASQGEALEAKFADLPMGPADIPGCEAIAQNCPKLFEEGGPMDVIVEAPMGEAPPE